MKKSDELKRQRADVIDEAQAIVDTAQAANRDMTSAENSRFNDLMASAEKFAADIEAQVTQEQNLASLRAAKIDMNKTEFVLPVHSSGVHRGQPQVTTRELSAFKGNGDRQQAERDAYDVGLWFKANIVRGGDSAEAREKLISRRGQTWVATQNESSPTDRGYLVPAPLQNAIMVYREQVGAVRKLGTIVPMASDTLAFPKQTSGTTVYYPGEESAITPSDANVAKVNLAAKKRAILVYLSNELKDDSMIPVVDWIVSDMGHQFALKEDQEGITGDGTSTYGGVQGIRPAVIAATASIYTPTADEDAWDELTLATHLATMSLIAHKYRVPTELSWLCSAAYKWQVMDRLAMATGNAPAQIIVDGVPQDCFLGYPVVLSDRMPTTTGVSQVSAIFGNFRRCVLLGERTGIRVQTSDHVAFTTDQIAIRAVSRYDINVHEEGDTSTAGAIAGLATHS